MSLFVRHGLTGLSSGTSTAELLVRYPSLTKVQRAVYREMLEHVRAGEDTFKLRERCQSDDVAAAVKALHYDHPELFWITGAVRIMTETRGSTVTMTITLETECPLALVPTIRGRIDAETRRFANTLPSNASSYEKVRAAYEFIILNTSYDSGAPHDQSMAGALLDHRAVCSGDARAFCYLLRSVDVPCACVQGLARSGGISGPHLWNVVCIDGVYTHVDVTWGELEDAQGAGSRSSEGISYGYLCVTTEEILRSRTIGDGQVLPRCTSRTYDWFGRQGLLLGRFSEAEFDALLAGSIARSSRELAVKFETSRAFDQCVRWMGTQKVFSGAFGERLRRASQGAAGSISWSRDNNLRIVTVSW